MTTITMRYIGEAFLATGKDIEARKFESREAKDWCASHYPGSPIHESGRTPPNELAGLRRGRDHCSRAGPQNKEPRRVGRGSLTLCFSPRFLAGISSGVVCFYCPICITRVYPENAIRQQLRHANLLDSEA